MRWNKDNFHKYMEEPLFEIGDFSNFPVIRVTMGEISVTHSVIYSSPHSHMNTYNLYEFPESETGRWIGATSTVGSCGIFISIIKN